MVELWFALLCFMLIVFVVLDGWDIGAGVLHLIVARTDAERREVIAAIGPLWSWHEVWLVAAGGTFILAFPKIMAAAFRATSRLSSICARRLPRARRTCPRRSP